MEEWLTMTLTNRLASLFGSHLLSVYQCHDRLLMSTHQPHGTCKKCLPKNYHFVSTFASQNTVNSIDQTNFVFVHNFVCELKSWLPLPSVGVSNLHNWYVSRLYFQGHSQGHNVTWQWKLAPWANLLHMCAVYI